MGSQQDNGYDLQTLHGLIAKYYEKMSAKKSKKWTSLEVLMPHMFQFEHLILAGDYVAAYNVLERIHERLMQWGHFERLVEMRKKLLDPECLAQLDLQVQGNTHGYHGQAYLGLGEFGDAKTHLEAAQAIAQQMDDKKGVGRWKGSGALAKLNLAYRDLPTNPTEAMKGIMEGMKGLEEALETAQQVGDSRYEVFWQAMLGITKKFLAEQLGWEPEKYIGEAIAHYKRAEETAKQEKIGEDTTLMLVYGSWARIEHDQKHYEKASELGKEALALARKLRDPRSQVIWLGNEGSSHFEQREVKEAIYCFEQAMAIAKDLNEPLGYAINKGRLGKVYNFLGMDEIERKQLERAKDYFVQAVEHFEDAKNTFKDIDPKRQTVAHIRQATAQVGSIVCEPGWAEEDDWAGSLAPALAGYQEALETYDYVDKDELGKAISNLEMIQQAGVAGLEPALELLKGYVEDTPQ
jgi:tetratricopeptide (TPR) repeat protein